MKRMTVAATIAALLLLGCGGDETESDPAPSSPPAAVDQVEQPDPATEIQALVDASIDALEAQDPSAYCDLMTPAAIAQIEGSEGTSGTCTELMAFAASQYSDTVFEDLRKPESIDVQGNTAVVTYSDPALGEFNAELVDGEWMIGPNSEG